MEIEKEIRREINRDGYFVALYEDDEDFPSYAYTIGLYEHNEHPELLIFGLDNDTMRILLGDAADRVKAGQKIEVEVPYDDFFEGYEVMFAHVNVDEYKGLFQHGVDHNDGVDYPMLQLIWPDQQKKWPWDDEFNEALKERQPVLTA